jgi:hypothetical protein
MKLGISYNLWNGEELLKSSILSIRNFVDFISIIYQEKSNHGNKRSDLRPFLISLLKEKLINKVHYYEPDLSLNPKLNELNKRNLGLLLSKNANCTHHLSIDVDEFYNKQFNKAKKYIEQYNVNVSVCQMQTYYKYPTLQVIPPEKYYVTFIFAIKSQTKFILNLKKYPVLVDPSRYIPIHGSFKIFKRKELEMHHMSYIRKNIRFKMENAGAKCNYVKKINRLVNHYENFKEGDQAMCAGKKSVYHNLHKVSNQFNIKI